MQLYPDNIIHVYNRGNNKQTLFFSDANYVFFIEKIRKYIITKADVLAYCLMPNHFHLLLYTTETSVAPKKIGSLMSTELNNAVRILLSSYTAAINKEKGFTGSLFQQNTKYKLLTGEATNKTNVPLTCFHYIHQNPVRANLVYRMEDWKYSSFNEYMSSTMNNICNKERALEFLDINNENFYESSYGVLKDEYVRGIF